MKYCHLASYPLSTNKRWLRFSLIGAFLLSASAMNHAQPGYNHSNNLRLSLDLSSRVVDFDAADEVGKVNVVGIDLHKVFNSPSGDIGPLVLQGYMTSLDNQIKHPPFFKDENDSRLVYRIFNFNYTALGSRLPNLRVGHFEVPYGLEHTINTNGTLRDYTHGPNLGVKADGGFSLNKELPAFEYEVSVTSGGVQEVDQVKDSYVYAARVGTPRDDNLVLGIAVFDTSLGTVSKQRLGLDSQYYLGPFAVFAQLDVGKNNDDIGIRLEPDRHWDMSAQIKQELDTFTNTNEDTLISAQLRYRPANGVE